MLELHNVSRRVAGETYLADVTLRFARGTFNTILGQPLAGKSSLLRVMAGLDPPSGGSVWFDGVEVTGQPARRRSVAMVYREPTNYPQFTVRQNIVTPMRRQGATRAEIAADVARIADLLQLTLHLDSMPAELGLADQQRLALARAIARKPGLVLLDEPLALIDPKVCETLVGDLPDLFAHLNAVVIYATSVPGEAIALSDELAAISEGRIVQVGPPQDVYRFPRDLASARATSSPPLNELRVVSREWKTSPADYDVAPQCRLPLLQDGAWTFGFRAHHLKLGPGGPQALGFGVRVISTESSGSESLVHLAFGVEHWTMLLGGVAALEPDALIDGHVDARHAMVFDARDRMFDGARREAA
jgi:glycerol transport system ATP-binding protein